MKKDKKFVILFLVIIYGSFIWLGLKHVLIKLNVVEFIRTDNWQVYEAKKVNNIIDKLENKFSSLKVSVENRANNYFPFYIQINELYQGLNYHTNKLFYQNVPLKTNNANEYMFYNKDKKFYYYETSLDDEELNNRVDKQIDYFNNLAKNDYDIYIYLPTIYQITNVKNNNLFSYVTKFEEGLDDKIKVKHLEVNSVDEYREMFYATDHHWNMHGALKGYYDILDMLDADKKLNLEIKTLTSQKYYGSLAKSVMNRQIADYIEDVDINLEYSVLVNGKEPDELFKPRKLIEGKANPYYDYYIQYFNGQYGNIVYDYHQPDKENLLIMSDSYAWQIDYLIAASFNKTHVINLRYDEFIDHDFNLTTYVKDNNISKVLFLYEGGSIVFDQYDYDFIGRVK